MLSVQSPTASQSFIPVLYKCRKLKNFYIIHTTPEKNWKIRHFYSFLEKSFLIE